MKETKDVEYGEMNEAYEYHRKNHDGVITRERAMRRKIYEDYGNIKVKIQGEKYED